VGHACNALSRIAFPAFTNPSLATKPHSSTSEVFHLTCFVGFEPREAAPSAAAVAVGHACNALSRIAFPAFTSMEVQLFSLGGNRRINSM